VNYIQRHGGRSGDRASKCSQGLKVTLLLIPYFEVEKIPTSLQSWRLDMEYMSRVWLSSTVLLYGR